MKNEKMKKDKVKKGNLEMRSRRRRLLPVACFSFLALLLTACDGSVFYDESRAVNEHGWSPADSVAFDVTVDDTLRMFNFLVEVRNSISYPYSNTFLFVHTTFPDGSVAQDTLEYPLADVSGRWMGRRIGRYVDTRYYFRRNVRFPMQGDYRFTLTNGMRDSAIAGLKDIGFRIEYAE